MLTINQALGYSKWFFRDTLGTPQDIFTQQNSIGASYCAPRVTGQAITLWGWPTMVGRKKTFSPFTFVRDNGTATTSWQFLPTAK